MIDLSLVPMEDLFKEIESRTSCLVAAYAKHKEGDEETTQRYGHGKFKDAVYLSTILNSMVINNFNGEMQTLQRIHDEGIL